MTDLRAEGRSTRKADPGPAAAPTAAASPPRLRRATAADAEALAAFAARLFRETYGPAADPRAGGGSQAADVDAYVDAHLGASHLAADLAAATSVIVLADVGEPSSALAGYAQLRVPSPAPAGMSAGEPAAELARLYVAPAWQGRGVAAALLEAVRGEAARAGARTLWLAAYQRNARAVAFYRRQGFAVAGAATFQMGREVQDDWVMVRPL